MKKSVSLFIQALAVVLLVVLDQITKAAAVAGLKVQPSFILIPGVFELQYVENRGAAFGVLENQRWFFLMIVAIVLVFLIWIFIRMPETSHYKPLRILGIFVAAGAIGNMIDRAVLGYVVDFFYFSLIDFPVFNVADIYVTVSMFFFIILILTLYKDDDFDFLKFKKKA